MKDTRLVQTSVTLKNGLEVWNFSSPHEFKFDDGSVLPAVPAEAAKELQLERVEELVPYARGLRIREVELVKVTYRLSSPVIEALERWLEKAVLSRPYSEQAKVLLIVPLPLLSLSSEQLDELWEASKAAYTALSYHGAGCIVVDRVSKLCSSKRFYVW